MMNCERCRTELEDFLYGELSDARVAEVDAHLAGCDACAMARQELERENEIFAQYFEESALEPTVEMWEGIHSRIKDERRSPAAATESRPGSFFDKLRGGGFGFLFRPAALGQLAFTVAIVLITAFVTMRYLAPRPEGDTKKLTAQVSPTPSPVIEIKRPEVAQMGEAAAQKPLNKVNRATASPAKPLTEEEALNQQIARAEREYQGAIKLLDRAIAKRKDTLDPDTVRQYESSLALIDSSIAASRRAMRERPEDQTASQFLLTAYARKVELMQEIAMK